MPFAQAIFGQRHEFDHALISLARVVADGENAVLVEDQPLGRRIFLEHIGCFLRERKARHDVGHEAKTVTEGLLTQGFAVRLVDQAQDRSGMCMIDELLRQERVQERFDRRVGRLRIDQRGTLRAHHLCVEQGHTSATDAGLLPHRRHSRGLDVCHVPAGTLDAENIRIVADQILNPRLYRGVAAAVQDKRGIAAKQAS